LHYATLTHCYLILDNKVTSFCYSGLLFLIVASESAQTKDSFFHPEKNETDEAYSNVTLNYEDHESFESSSILEAGTETLKINQNNLYGQVRLIISLVRVFTTYIYV